MSKKDRNYDNYHTFDDFIKNVKIPEKKWKFFENFINRQADTFGNAVKSYHAAGYAKTTTSKYRARDLYNSAMMQRLLSLYHQKTAEKRENMSLSVFDKTDNDLLWCIERAKLAGDYQAVRAASMDRAKLHGQVIDKHQVIDPTTEAEIDRTKAKLAAKLAQYSIVGDLSEIPENVIDTEFLDDDCTTELYNDLPDQQLLN